MDTALGTVTLGLYVISLALYGWLLYSNHRRIGVAATLSLGAALAAHYFALHQRAVEVNAVPYQDLYGSMSLFAWLLAATYLGLEAWHRQRAVGPFVLPFVIGCLLAVTWLEPATVTRTPDARGPLFALHVTLNVLAYAAFAIAFVLSAIYLLQNRLLRDHHLGAMFWRFPALEVLERMSRSSVMVGVAALVVGIAFGAVWSKRLNGSYVTGDAKEIISLLILACYVAYIVLARRTRWRGARAAVLCIVSFGLVVFSYTVVNLYMSGYHRYF
ncbi:MAG: cytochrome C assembly family protein [Candidatus Acidiferrales bacterium]